VGIDQLLTLISGGVEHTCVVTGDDRPSCWGNNGAGQVGDGTNTPALAARPGRCADVNASQVDGGDCIWVTRLAALSPSRLFTFPRSTETDTVN
jgi:alpha-tubulin suppressor-like RCC1 family protein